MSKDPNGAAGAESDRASGGELLVRTSKGRWVWWPGLQLVDYIPKGKRSPTWSAPLSSREDTREGAYKLIIRALSGDRR